MVSLKNKKIFLECLRELSRRFKKIDHFGVIKLVGNMTFEKDIDLVFCPSEKVKTSEFFIAQLNFLERLKKKYEERASSRLICFPFVGFQEEVEFISKRRKEDIFLHVINLYKGYKKMTGSKSFIQSPGEVIYGKILNIRQVKTPKNERFFDYLYYSELFFAEYPLSLLNHKLESQIKHIYKYLKKDLNAENSNKKLGYERLKKMYCDCLRKIDN
jgi:hypothetical protein